MEVMWAPVDGALLPVSLVGKPHEWFHFDPEGLLRFRSRTAPLFRDVVGNTVPAHVVCVGTDAQTDQSSAIKMRERAQRINLI